MSAKIAAWFIIGCVCACATRGAYVAGTFRVVESTERVADLTRRVDGGTLLSRDLLVAPAIADLQVSRDGKYYSFVRRGDAPAQLYVGRAGHAANPLDGLGHVIWIGDHSLLFERGDAWHRADPTDNAFTRVAIKQIVREVENDYQHRQGIADISRDGSRVIFNLGDPNTKSTDKLSPWRYDVASGALTRVIDNTRYREIILDERGQPAFAIDRVERSGTLQVFERTPRGWLERTIDLPSHTSEVLDYHGGTLALRTGTDDDPQYVLWEPATNSARPWFPPDATDAIVADDRRTILAWRDKVRWHAVDARYTRLVDAFVQLGIDRVSNGSSNVWTASAPIGRHRAYYIVDVVAGEIREIGPQRDRTPSMQSEVATVPSLSGEPPDEVMVFRADGPPHGVVFWGTSPYTSHRDREQTAQLLTSRGYHLVTGTDSHVFDAARGAHAAWAVGRFGALPIACVNLRTCDFGAEWRYGSSARPANLPARPAAVVRRPTGLNESGWEEPDDSSEPVVPELLFGAGYTRTTSLEEYDEEQAYVTRPEYVARRDRAPVAGIAFRGAFASSAERELVEFAVIEGFLAQHLGGRMEPMPWDRLGSAGLRVIYGLDKLAFLAGHPELALPRLGPAQRAELAQGFASFSAAIYALPIKPPCDEVPERIRNLVPPPAVVAHRETDEVQVLINKLTVELGDVALAAGCTTGMITSAVVESIQRARPAGEATH